MCTQSDMFPLGPAETARIVDGAARFVACRTFAEQEELCAHAHEHVPRFVSEWRPALEVAPAKYLRRRVVWILYDHAKRALRRAQFHGPLPEDQALENANTLWQDAGATLPLEDRVMAAELVARLPERERRVVARKFWGDANHRQIAAELGVSEATVERAMASATARMRRFAEETEETEGEEKETEETSGRREGE